MTTRLRSSSESRGRIEGSKPSTHERPSTHDSSRCVFCRNLRDFKIPDHLLAELAKGNVVIFAGAGVSTESNTVYPWTLYDEIQSEIGAKGKKAESFAETMSRFCAQENGRQRLLERIRKRLDYVDAFPELYRTATRFHRELSTLFYINTYVTTNWDDYFERECGAIPFVTGEDFALWHIRGRKVFKIHGSISNIGSLIATSEDYGRARRSLERGALGAVLKSMLATKTILYVGYSFSDHDFASIQRYISKDLRAVAPSAYVVSIDNLSHQKFQRLGLTPIFADATQFIETLKAHVKEDGHLLDDHRFNGISQALSRVRREHSRLHREFSIQRTPRVVFAAFYQDGLKHAFERIMARAHSGEYSHRCDLVRKVHAYEKILRENLRNRRYADVSYVEGYMNGLTYLLMDNESRRALPFYFVFGSREQPTTLPHFRKSLALSSHKAADREAHRIAASIDPNDEVHHTPFVNWTVPEVNGA